MVKFNAQRCIRHHTSGKNVEAVTAKQHGLEPTCTCNECGRMRYCFHTKFDSDDPWCCKIPQHRLLRGACFVELMCSALQKSVETVEVARCYICRACQWARHGVQLTYDLALN